MKFIYFIGQFVWWNFNGEGILNNYVFFKQNSLSLKSLI